MGRLAPTINGHREGINQRHYMPRFCVSPVGPHPSAVGSRRERCFKASLWPAYFPCPRGRRRDLSKCLDASIIATIGFNSSLR